MSRNSIVAVSKVSDKGVASWSKLRRTARAARPRLIEGLSSADVAKSFPVCCMCFHVCVLRRCVAFDLDGCLWHPAMAKLRGEGARSGAMRTDAQTEHQTIQRFDVVELVRLRPCASCLVAWRWRQWQRAWADFMQSPGRRLTSPFVNFPLVELCHDSVASNRSEKLHLFQKKLRSPGFHHKERPSTAALTTPCGSETQTDYVHREQPTKKGHKGH